MSYIRKHKHYLITFVILIVIAGVSWKYLENSKLKTQNEKLTTQNEKTATEQYNNNVTIDQPVTSYRLQVTNTSTALEAMQNAKMDFKTKTFAGLGEFVEEISGLKNDPQNGKYWIYYINGESAKLGISTQIVKPGDLIEWKYGNANL